MGKLAVDVEILEAEVLRLRTQCDVVREENRRLSRILNDQPLWMRVHVVKEGDTLSDIVSYYSGLEWQRAFTVQEIAVLNRLTDPNLIRPGDVLMIPHSRLVRP